MARNPTGCDVRKTCLNAMVTLAAMLAIGIADHYGTVTPPQATLSPPGRNTLEDGAVELTCDVMDTPNPRVQWFHNKSMVRAQCEGCYCPGQPNSLTVTGGAQCVGTYHCEVSNQYGTAVSDKALLYLPDIPRWDDLRVDEVSVNAEQGVLIAIPVNFTKQPEGIIFWEVVKNGKPVAEEKYFVTSAGELFFPNVSLEDNDLQMNCEYILNERVSKCGKKKLLVRKKSSGQSSIHCWHCKKSHLTVLEGSDVTLDCLVAGSPSPVLTWSRDGHSISHTGFQYKLHRVRHSQEGTYSCKAKKHDNIVKTFSIKVEAKPHDVEKPQDVIQNINNLENQQVKFRCAGKGRPRPRAQWWVNDTTVDDLRNDLQVRVDGESLTFLNISHELSATIHCNLSNSQGYHWFQARLSVTGIKVVTTPDTSTSTSVSTTSLSSTTTGRAAESNSAMSTTKRITGISSSESPPVITPAVTTPTPTIQSQILVTSSSHKVETDDPPAIVVTVPYKALFIGIGVAGVVLVVLSVICTILCYRACRKTTPQEEPRYPRSVSNLSYMSQLHRIREFDDRASDRASDDSGIDERSHMKSKMSISRSENHDNHINELEEIVEHVV